MKLMATPRSSRNPLDFRDHGPGKDSSYVLEADALVTTGYIQVGMCLRRQIADGDREHLRLFKKNDS